MMVPRIAVFFLLVGVVPSADLQACSATEPCNRERLLQYSLQHTDKCRLAVVQASKEARLEDCRRLAEILLGEWGLPADAEVFQSPRPTCRPRLDPKDIKHPGRIKFGLVAVEVLVEASGKPSSARVIKSSGSAELDVAATGAFMACTYRPARVKNRYVKGKFVGILRVHPR